MMFSLCWREMARRYHKVEFGLYSYCPGLKPGSLPSGTKVGRFCSLASDVLVVRWNHPTSLASQHPVFYLRALGVVQEDLLPEAEENPLVIGHDVWIGAGVIILPKCEKIGDGAIVAAGSVVTKDVPPFMIVAGNPARPVRKRFTPEAEDAIAASEWWLEPVDKLAKHADLFTGPLEGERLERFRAVFPGRKEKGRRGVAREFPDAGAEGVD